MLRYILLIIIVIRLYSKNNIIEGADTQCCINNCSGKEEADCKSSDNCKWDPTDNKCKSNRSVAGGELTRGFHNSSCVYVKDENGDNVPNSAPEPIQRCFRESDRNKSFNCDGTDSGSNCDDSSKSQCVGCNDICPDSSLDECVPTIREDGSSYKTGGYCQDSSCSDKEEDDCKSSDNCNWTGEKCESKKYTFKGEEKHQLKTNIGSLLNHSNSEKYKKYANLKCNPHKGKASGDILGGSYMEGTDDGPFSNIVPDSNYDNILPGWIKELLKIIGLLILSYLLLNFEDIYKNFKLPKFGGKSSPGKLPNNAKLPNKASSTLSSSGFYNSST